MTLKYEKEQISLSDFKVIPTYFYNTVGALEREGLIESVPDAADARKRNYKLTAKGQKEIKKVKGLFF